MKKISYSSIAKIDNLGSRVKPKLLISKSKSSLISLVLIPDATMKFDKNKKQKEVNTGYTEFIKIGG